MRETLIDNSKEIGNVAYRIKRALLKVALVLFSNMLVASIPAFAQQAH